MKVPGFSDIGKKAKDLLGSEGKGGGFQYDQKLKIASKASDGVAFTLSATKKGDKVSNDLKATYSFDPYSFEVTAAQTGKVGLKATVADLLTPGLKCSASLGLPPTSPAKLSFGYSRDYLTFSSNVELTGSPKVDAAVTTGHGNVVFGGDCSYDASKGILSRWAVGTGYTTPEYQVGMLLADKGESVKVMYSHNLGKTNAGAEIVSSLKEEGATAFTVGASRVLASGATFKSKMDNQGILSVLWEQKLDNSAKIGLSGQADVKDLEKGAKVGVSFEMS